MRAALTSEPGGPTEIVGDVDLADPGPGQVRVAIHHCGLCHSDVTVMSGATPSPVPCVTGHEASGVVTELGPGVTRLAVGDRVLLTPVPPCNSCYHCLRGEHSLCVNCESIASGTFVDGTTGLSRKGELVYRGVGMGAFADEVLSLETGAIKVPDDVDLAEVAVIGCAVQTGVGSVLNIAKVEEGATVLVMGLGGIGMSVVQGARLAGASRIIVSDPVASRRDLSQGFGATDAIDPTQTDVIEAVMKTTGGIGADHAFEAVGAQSLIETGFNAIRNGGSLTLIGFAPLDHTLAGILPAMLMFSQKRLLGSVLGGVNSLRDIPRYIDLHRAGRLDLAGLVTSHRPLEELDLAVGDMDAGRGIRTVFDLVGA